MVVLEAVVYSLCCVIYDPAVDVGGGYDGEPQCAMLCHACRILGLSNGECRSGKRSTLQVRLRSMTWRRAGGVYTRTHLHT